MFRERRYLMGRCLTFALVLSFAGMVVGCGQSPISSQDNEVVSSGDDVQGGVVRAAKRAKRAKRSKSKKGIYIEQVSGKFSAKRGGRLKVRFPKYIGRSVKGGVQVREATFVVPKGALEKNVTITMDVMSGKSLDKIQVVFGPPGTAFIPSARLELKFWGGKQDELEVYHYSADQVDKAVVEKHRGGWKSIIEVPGFSRYSLGGDY